MAEDRPQFATFDEFWPYYLRQHKKRETRLVHVVGTILALLSIVKAVISFKIGYLILAPIIGYGFAWVAHTYIEENQPATFDNPKWSLRGDLEMTKLWVTGKLEAELAKHNITT